MVDGELADEVRESELRNAEDVIRHARWEARMVKELGVKWFKIRDEWLRRAWESDREFLRRNERVRNALIKALTLRVKGSG